MGEGYTICIVCKVKANIKNKEIWNLQLYSNILNNIYQ